MYGAIAFVVLILVVIGIFKLAFSDKVARLDASLHPRMVYEPKPKARVTAKARAKRPEEKSWDDA